MANRSHHNVHMGLKALIAIWRSYDRWGRTAHEWACRKHCATCCTCNVTITTLEGYWMVEKMGLPQLNSVKRALAQAQLPDRFRPLITTNGIAEKCIAGEQWPEDTHQLEQAPCPLLAHDICTIYDWRPFGCRCLLSLKDCRASGHAEMDPWLLTLNHAVLQIIEHLDQRGYTGNLIDVLRFMADDENRRIYARGERLDPVPDLIPNRPLKMLLVPPEHREKIEPFLRQVERLLSTVRES